MDAPISGRFFRRGAAQASSRRRASPKDTHDQRLFSQPDQPNEIGLIPPPSGTAELPAWRRSPFLAPVAARQWHHHFAHRGAGKFVTGGNATTPTPLSPVPDRAAASRLARAGTFSANGFRRIYPTPSAPDYRFALEIDHG